MLLISFSVYLQEELFGLLVMQLEAFEVFLTALQSFQSPRAVLMVSYLSAPPAVLIIAFSKGKITLFR